MRNDMDQFINSFLPYLRPDMEQPILDFSFEMPTKFKTRFLMEYKK